MDLDQKYEEIIMKLEAGARALEVYNPFEIQEIVGHLKTEDEDILRKALCLAEHSRHSTLDLEEGLVKLLKRDELPKDILIHALHACRLHCIQARQLKGERLSADFLLALKELIHHEEPEVKEWTLRTIDECGPQGVFFYKDIKNIQPKFSWIFNRHSRAVVQLKDMFHKRWINKD